MIHRIRAEAQKLSRAEVLIKSLLLSASVLLLCCSSALAFCFEEAGRAYEINPSLLKSIAKTESNMNPKAVNINKNGSVDIGLMQINSFWIKTLGLDSGKLISDPCYNTMIGAKVLKQCIDRYGYTWEAVGCYNATSTPKRVKYSWKIFNNLKAEGSRLKAEGSGQQSAVSSQNKSNSELYFIVRDKIMEVQ